MPLHHRARRRAGRIPALALVALLVVAAAACSSTDGRELAEPDPDLTLTTPPTAAPTTSLTPFLTVSSPAIAVNGVIPKRFTCDGADVSPPLTIADVPADAEDLVIALTDPDAGGFVHWVMAFVPPDTTEIAAGEVPDGAVLYPNDYGDRAYAGPCPPEGETHTYVVTLYVLTASAVDFVGPDQINGAGLIDSVSRLASTSAALTASYVRR